jgi:hypothetical protein
MHASSAQEITAQWASYVSAQIVSSLFSIRAMCTCTEESSKAYKHQRAYFQAQHRRTGELAACAKTLVHVLTIFLQHMCWNRKNMIQTKKLRSYHVCHGANAIRKYIKHHEYVALPRSASQEQLEVSKHANEVRTNAWEKKMAVYHTKVTCNWVSQGRSNICKATMRSTIFHLWENRGPSSAHKIMIS